ncbi:MAG: hypothetical protein NC399_09875 [Muribaculum sp.]|nr:hypothetical protein [Muribaculum sp.]
MISVRTNLPAWNAGRQLNITTQYTAKSAEKLASGYRINRAADDAAGLAVSEKMRRQIRGLHQTADNIQEGIGYVQTADGALGEVQEIMQRMNVLSVKAANGTCTAEERYYIDQEIRALKLEMNRIFNDTTYNTRKIWKATEQIPIGIEQKQAVTFPGDSYHYKSLTNANCGVVACGSYTLHADQDGLSVAWTGYDGNSYQTEPVTWETLKTNGYRFEMSNYFGDPADPDNKLYDNGVPVFSHTVSLTVEETATLDDIIASLNNVSLGSSASASMSASFEDSHYDYRQNGVSPSASLSYGAAYVSHRDGNGSGRDFDAGDDTFIEAADPGSGTPLPPSSPTGNLSASPQASTVEEARASKDKWSFAFYMEGIGPVTATSRQVSYYASGETADDDENCWWRWEKYSDNLPYQHTIPRYVGSGTFSDIMETLTGGKGSSTPGLLSEENGGASDTGGTVFLHFNNGDYTYGKNSASSNVGSLTITFKIKPDDTEETVMQRVNNALNEQTVLDLYSDSADYDSCYIYKGSPNTHLIDVPIYGGVCNFYVQAGTEAGQHIEINYDSLGIIALGLYDINTLTQKDAGKAIDRIKAAQKIVNKQRADFGAYQNRLEHACQVNQNTEENTQASESVIRDTDMAQTMIAYANAHILQQAGISVLTQANKQADLVLQLIQ